MTTTDPPCAARASRRDVLVGGVIAAVAMTIPPLLTGPASAATPISEPRQRNERHEHDHHQRRRRDFYKDWGHGQPIVFHHGWPLSSDDWDAQMLFFLQQRLSRHWHRPPRTRPLSQVWDGHDMDHYAADAADVVDHLDLRNAVHIGHSTGGGEVARYVARHGRGRVAKAVLMSAVVPLMLKTPSNPDGLPIQAFDGLRAGLAANRAQFYRDVPAGPFYGFDRPGAKADRRRDSELVAPGHDGRREGPVR